MTQFFLRPAAVGVLLLSTASAMAAELRQRAYTDPKHANADFRIQGEYTGTVQGREEPKVLAVQVVALGRHQFRAVGYVGGLPGAGWDGKPPEEVEAAASHGVVTFQGKFGSGTIRNGAMTVVDSQGQKIGQLQRIIRQSPTAGAKPPAGAVVLFDGTSADPWVSAADNKSPARMSPEKFLMQGANSRRLFGKVQLHVEFRLPYVPTARDQSRGNSGCYLQKHYEVQMLDSFGLKGESYECGGIYRFTAPKVNMCYPPLSWQTYDIDFTPAAFGADGKKLHNARLTLRHNGVLVQDDVEVPGPTGGLPVSEEDGKPNYIGLQDHFNEVRFRNIWVVEKK